MRLTPAIRTFLAFAGSRTSVAPSSRSSAALARRLDIRLSSHPGQYTVLNSEDERTRRLAVEELEVQAELMDAMELGPEAVVVLHVGGAVGGVDAALDRFEAGFELLSISRPRPPGGRER